MFWWIIWKDSVKQDIYIYLMQWFPTFFWPVTPFSHKMGSGCLVANTE